MINKILKVNDSDSELIGCLLLLVYLINLMGFCVWLVASFQVLSNITEYRSQQIKEVNQNAKIH